MKDCQGSGLCLFTGRDCDACRNEREDERMHWNHRVMRQHFDGYDEVAYGIREVFYDDDGEIEGWTAEPMDPHGETVEELRADLERMLACLDRPVLDEREELACAEERLVHP